MLRRAHIALLCLLAAVAKADVLLDIVAEVKDRERELSELLGPYKFYVYSGGAFDALSVDLVTGTTKVPPMMNEYRAPVWIHRALLADPSRTLNPWEADLFFVPAYLQVSSALSNRAGSGRSVTKPQHQKRIGNWIAALQASPWFRRHGGADHLFSVGDLNPGWSAAAGMPQVKAVLHRGYTGTFEMNGAWSGDWDVNRMIAMPYVANDDIVRPAMETFAWGGGALKHDQPHSTKDTEVIGGWAQAIATEARQARKVSLYFAAAARNNAIGWANCSRKEMEKLQGFPHAVIKISGRRRTRNRRRLSSNLASAKKYAPHGIVKTASAAVTSLTAAASSARGVSRMHHDGTAAAASTSPTRNSTLSTSKGTVSGNRLHVQSSKKKQHHKKKERRQLRFAENAFADHMRASAICPLMCGDTPTSRRTYDAFIAGCVPLFVGTRLWGRCDPPCRPGWGWRVPGAPFPHLPFHGLWIDWSRFPLLDELALVSAPTHEAAEDVLKRALKPFHDQVDSSVAPASAAVVAAEEKRASSSTSASSSSISTALERARAYMFATRRHLMYGAGDAFTSNDFGLAPRRLVEATLLRMRGLYSSALRPALPAPPASVADVTALVSSSLIGSDYRGTKHDGTSAGTKEKHISTHTNTSMLDMPSLLVPLSATLAATRAPYTENMVKYHAQDRKTASKKAQQAASQTSAESESEVRARAEKEITAIIAQAKVKGASASRRRLDTLLPVSNSSTVSGSATSASALIGASGAAFDNGLAKGEGKDQPPPQVSKGQGDHHNGPSLLASSSKHVIMTAEDHIRHNAFADLHNSLFDWIPSTNKDYSAKMYLKHNKTAGGAA